MSLLDWFIDDPAMDPAERLVMKGLQRYGQFEAMEKVSGNLMPDQDRDMDRELKSLDIRTKKRMLGLPENGEDLDEARNNNRPFWTVTAQHVLQRIPETGFMSGKTPLSPIFKTARSVPHDSIPSISFAGRIARALR